MITISPAMFEFATSFLFSFAVVYGLLTIANIFKDNKNVNVILAIVFGLVSAAYPPFVAFIQGILPIASIFLVIIFFIVLLQKIFSQSPQDKDQPVAIAMSLAAVLLLVGLLWNKISGFVPAGISSQDVLWITGIVIIILIFYAAYKTPKHETIQG